MAITRPSFASADKAERLIAPQAGASSGFFVLKTPKILRMNQY